MALPPLGGAPPPAGPCRAGVGGAAAGGGPSPAWRARGWGVLRCGVPEAPVQPRASHQVVPPQGTARTHPLSCVLLPRPGTPGPHHDAGRVSREVVARLRGACAGGGAAGMLRRSASGRRSRWPGPIVRPCRRKRAAFRARRGQGGRRRCCRLPHRLSPRRHPHLGVGWSARQRPLWRPELTGQEWVGGAGPRGGWSAVTGASAWTLRRCSCIIIYFCKLSPTAYSNIFAPRRSHRY